MDAKKDLYLILLLIAVIFIIWLFGGIASKPAGKNGLFFKSPIEAISGKILSPFNLGKDGMQVSDENISPHRDKASLRIGDAVKKADPKEEYMEIRMSPSNKESLDITGWTIENKNGVKVNIGSGVYLPYLYQENIKINIILSAGEKAIIPTGQSPMGMSFKLNKCTGYFNQLQKFYPSLPSECPHPIRDEVLPASLDNSCIDYINNNFDICTEYITLSSTLSDFCKQYINDRINYGSCVNWHKKDSDFYKKEWRVYLYQSKELWGNESDQITLRDENNKIIDSQSY